MQGLLLIMLIQISIKAISEKLFQGFISPDHYYLSWQYLGEKKKDHKYGKDNFFTFA